MEKPADSSAVRTQSNDTRDTRTVREERPGKHVDTMDVVLENESVWSRFHSVGTEMIITEQGRRMFPWCRFRLAGLHPKRCYSLLMDVVPADDYRHRWNGEMWETDGAGEPRVPGEPYFHPDSPALGQRWMDGPVSFYKVKLTHDTVDQDGCVALRPMHRYQPRLHIVPHHQWAVSLQDPDVQMFTFTNTEFYAVTSFQNPKIKQLKINCNPFMLAFREDGEKSLRPAVSDRCQSRSAVSHSHDDDSEDHFSTRTRAEFQSDEERVLSDRQRFICDQLIGRFTTEDSEATGQPHVSSDSSEAHRPVSRTSGENVVSAVMTSSLHRQQKSVALASSRRSAVCNPRGVGWRSRCLRKARKAKSKRWSNVKYARAAVLLPPADTSTQPDLEDVDGVLFVSFGGKEALDVHVVNMRRSVEPSSSSPLAHIQTENLRCDKEKQYISQQQLILVQHLKKLKNRQIIHPALQDVGLKLNLLDPAVPIDLHYLGVSLTSPALSVDNLTASSDVPFVSPTGKTDDPIKTKGCHNTSGQSSIDSSINRSAFFSDELDEYLESEAQQICQRAAVFSTSSPSSVVYQMPDKSSSYVRTLDSVLQTRGATAAPPTASTDRRNPSNVLPCKPAVKTTPESSGRSRQSTSVKITVKNAQRSPQERHHSTRNKPEAEVRPGGHLSRTSHIIVSTPAKYQLKLLEQEREAVYHGKSRTFVTTERAEFALTSLVTSEKSKKPVFGKHRVSQDVCGNDFCRLGCVCESLTRKIRGPTHCRRLQCMFGCDCFKHKVFLIRPPERSQTHVRKIPLMAFPVDPQLNHRPDPAAIITRLWNRRSDDRDTELIFTPTAATSNPPALQKNTCSRVYVPRPNPVVQEMEKDPVYRYLESKMTCARVREYNSNPPPQFYIIPVKKKRCDNETSEVSRSSPARTHLTSQSPDKNAAASKEPEATKVLEIISECNWEAQRTLVLKEVFRCVDMNLLSSSLFIDIFKVDLLSTTLKKDDGRCTLSYKVCVSLREPLSRTDEPRNKANKQEMFTERTHVNTSDCQVYESSCNDETHFRSVDNEIRSLKHFPLLSRVIPAGCLKASVKMSACPRPVQVNGKSYTKANLLLGQIGSLHPANRLAAYVTGRMKPMCRSKSPGKLVPETLPDRTPASLKDTQPPVIPGPPHETIYSPLNVCNPVLIPNLSSTPNHITSSNPRLTVPNSIPPPKHTNTSKPNIVLPASALPPGQSVVLHPVSGVSGANICQFNGQIIQLFPLPAVLPIHPQAKENAHQKAQTLSVQPPQMIQTTAKPQKTAAFPKRHPFIAPKILFLPRTTGFGFTSDTTAQGPHGGLPGKTGTFSFRICPPAEGQTDAGESSSTVLLPGGYRLMKLPVEDHSCEDGPSAGVPSASHLMKKRTAQHKHHSNGATERDSFAEANAKQKGQIVPMTHVNAASSSRVDVTNKDPVTHESSVDIKTEPDDITTQPPFTSDAPEDGPEHFIKTEPYDSTQTDSYSTHRRLLKQEPSSSQPVDNPENTEESNDAEKDFVVIKIETLDETSETNQFSHQISENPRKPVNDSPSSRSDTHLKIQPAESNCPVLKTDAEFTQPVNVMSCLKPSLNNAQQHAEVKTCSWPFRLMQKAMNSCEDDKDEQRDLCELSSSINDSDDIIERFTEDWTPEESSSEDDINLDPFDENAEKMNKSRRTSKEAGQLRLSDGRGGFQEGQMQYDVVEHGSHLCVYKRAWRLNRSARRRRRRAELPQCFDTLKRILNIEDPDMSVQDVLLQACDMIGALEHRSNCLMKKKKSLIQKHSRYISLISQLSGTVRQHTGQKSTAETSPHKHSVAKRPSGLPNIVLQSFSKI
ncbi:MAX gene-associated protein [Triplophysa rosa]|uniref:MAX gene-associated protein n=1 Tax=Triplophysa rosa TaxID=992332 RepID=UPI002545F69D|nr:MAX gene-associated protein [Triplophysa rosa]